MASCKCKEMPPYKRDIQKLSGTIPNSITKANSAGGDAISALKQASAGVCEALAFNSSAFTVATSLTNVIVPLLAAIGGAAGASSAESARLSGILNGLQTEDTTYHREQAAAAKKKSSSNTESSSSNVSSTTGGSNRNMIS